MGAQFRAAWIGQHAYRSESQSGTGAGVVPQPSTKGQPTKQVTVQRAEVIYVSGNDVVFKTENGEIRYLTVPDRAGRPSTARNSACMTLRRG